LEIAIPTQHKDQINHKKHHPAAGLKLAAGCNKRKEKFMNKKAITSDKALKPIGPFSTAVECRGTVYVSGITAIDPKTGKMIDGGVEEQTDMILSIMKGIMEDAGTSMNNVLKCTVFLDDVNDFSKVNEVYGRHFNQPYPARICVQVAKIPMGALVEIDAIASK